MPNSFDLDKMNDALCIIANNEEGAFIAEQACIQMARFHYDHVRVPNATRQDILSTLVDDMSDEVLKLNYLNIDKQY